MGYAGATLIFLFFVAFLASLYARKQDKERTESVEKPPKKRKVRASGTYKITYADSKGDISQRTIKVLSATLTTSDVAVLAYCYRRKGLRMFLQSRMKEIISIETGEILDDIPLDD